MGIDTSPPGLAGCPVMQVVKQYRGLSICRLSTGQLVVLDPRQTPQDRLELVAALEDAGAFDSLFFPTLEDAQEVIDELIAERSLED